ncbi:MULTISPECIES: thioesterase family protein [unclassified Aureimonas]|uniref:acyl-CoA thioesterase n=1 Tax=unclassified Aureimonas TaxID=2615206 RepID=UPI00071F3054|nr:MULTISPECIES: thioesterase family protein [unclassified Aureimonas]ALN71937.1 hypothetical protein M673_04370 [Aureimonas sp. AU20]
MSPSEPSPPRPRPRSRAEFAAFIEVSTRWSDNDAYGHMNNAAYYTFFDTAVTSWLLQQGLPTSPGETLLFVAETGCRYFSEIGFPDRVTVGLRIARLGSSSIAYDIALFRNEDDIAAAEGVFVHVHVSAETRRPVPLPDGLRAILERIVR